MKKLRLRLLAARIEWTWWLIARERKKGRELLESGQRHSSKELLKLNQRFSKHCASVMKAQRTYEAAIGLGCGEQTVRMQE